MARCAFCLKPATGECPIQNKYFCGELCQIGCRNTVDIFTQEDIVKFDKKLIIQVGEDCYHLPSLYNWLFNLERETDPLTNIKLSDEQIEFVYHTAKKRFPLLIEFEKFTIETTSLISIYKLTIRLYEMPLGIGFNEVLEMLSKRYIHCFITTTRESVPLLIRKHGHEKQLYEIGVESNLNIYLDAFEQTRLGKTELYEWYLNIATKNDFPIAYFNRKYEDSISRSVNGKIQIILKIYYNNEATIQLNNFYVESHERLLDILDRVSTKYQEFKHLLPDKNNVTFEVDDERYFLLKHDYLKFSDLIGLKQNSEIRLHFKDKEPRYERIFRQIIDLDTFTGPGSGSDSCSDSERQNCQDFGE
jgi:hypothetical protein